MPTTFEPPPSIPAQDEADALFEEARRRQRRRRRGIAVLAAALATALFLEAGGSGPKPPGSGVQPGHARTHPASSSAALPGADASLLIWPGVVEPANGQLNAEPPARIVNLDTGRSIVRPIPGLASVLPSLVPVGHWLIYNSTHGEAVIRSDLRGAPRIIEPWVIGHAGGFAPGVNDQIWLVYSARGASNLTSVQSVSLPSGRRGPKLTLPKHIAEVVEGTDHGLLLSVGTGPSQRPPRRLELWKPGSPSVMLAHETSGRPTWFAADGQIVVLDSNCGREPNSYRPYTASSQSFPMIQPRPRFFSPFEALCRRLTVIELAHGYRWSLPAPAETRGWKAFVPGTDRSAISPDGLLLVASAALTTRRSQLYLLSLSRSKRTSVAVPGHASGRIAWTLHGDWLLYTSGSHQVGPSWIPNTVQDELRAYRLGEPTRTTRIPCCNFQDMFSIP